MKDEKTSCFQEAFEIARKGRSLKEKHVEIFEKLRGFLHKDTVDMIDSFKPGNKGILLVGGNDDLLRGTASYIWHKHDLQYHKSGDKIKKEGSNIRLEKSCLMDIDFHDYSNEEEIIQILFTRKDGLINKNKLGTVLFLRDIDAKFTKLLQRIGRAVRDFRFYRNVETNPIFFAEYGDRKKLLYQVMAPSIVIANVKQRAELPENFIQNFKIINLGPNKDSDSIGVVIDTEEKKSKITKASIVKFPTPSNSKWSDVKIGIDFYNEKVHTKVKKKSKVHTFSNIGLKHSRSKDKRTVLLERLIMYAGAENNVIPTSKLSEKEYKKLDNDTKRLNTLFRGYFGTIDGSPITYKKGEGFKSLFGKLYLISTDYDKSSDVTTNELGDVPDSKVN